MARDDFDAFFAKRARAAEAYVKGDGGLLDALVAHEGEATFFSPQGDVVTGAEAVARRFLDDSNGFRPNGTTRFAVLHQAVGADLAFWTGFQIATVQIGEMPQGPTCGFALPRFSAGSTARGSSSTATRTWDALPCRKDAMQFLTVLKGRADRFSELISPRFERRSVSRRTRSTRRGSFARSGTAATAAAPVSSSRPTRKSTCARSSARSRS
jgi:hypothetical protein